MEKSQCVYLCAGGVQSRCMCVPCVQGAMPVAAATLPRRRGSERNKINVSL